MARAAVIGPAIYEEVNKLVADGKTRTAAFAAVAKKRKARDGTVAANYYRVARAAGASKAPRKRRAGSAPARTTGRPRGTAASGNGDLAALAKQIGDLTQELVRKVEERDRAIRQLLG
jgi:hypothetical protein